MFVKRLVQDALLPAATKRFCRSRKVLGSVLLVLVIAVWVIGIRASWKYHSQAAPHYSPDRRFVLLVCVLFGPFAMTLHKVL